MAEKIAEEIKQKVLEIAGNPKNARVEILKSVPNGYRVLQRNYRYDPAIKRSAGSKKAIGVVIDGKWLTEEEYSHKYTHRGALRVHKTENSSSNVSSSVGSAFGPNDSEGTASEQDQSSVQERFDGCVHQKLLGAIPIMYQTAVNCGIAEDLTKAYGANAALKVLSLAMHWLMATDNAASRFSRFCDIFALPFHGHLTEGQISSLYMCLGRDKAALNALFALRKGRIDSDRYVSYESADIPANVSDIDCIKDLMFEESEFGSMAHLSMLVDQKSGMPLMYRLFDRASSNCVTAGDLMKRTQKLAGQGKNLIFVFDAEYETMSGLAECSQSGNACIMALKVLDQNVIRTVRKIFADCLDVSSVIAGTTVHGHTEKVTLKHRGIAFDAWIHIFLSEENRAIERMSFLNHLEWFEQQWKQSDRKQRAWLLKEPLIEFYRHTTVDGQLVRDGDVLDEHIRNFGFFEYVSLKEMTASVAYHVYQGRRNIEKCFESGRLNTKSDTICGHDQYALEGRFVVAFVCMTILAELESHLKREHTLPDRRKKPVKPCEYTVQDVLDITRGINVSYEAKSKRSWVLGQLKETKRLLVACGLEDDLYDTMPSYITSLASLK
ncbi:MAG: hypothetical protein IJ523_09500 [Succinivibrionaceae bacterium]|nr:hypothetical protein [Succinivibrionaceae bacterium]